jgi:hypothetical protein
MPSYLVLEDSLEWRLRRCFGCTALLFQNKDRVGDPENACAKHKDGNTNQENQE